MGSPYHVHACSSTHSVKTLKGFERILKTIIANMEIGNVSSYDEMRYPEKMVLGKLYYALHTAITSRAKVSVFLEARYEWKGWEKFQSIIVFDFRNGKVVDLRDVKWDSVPFDFSNID